MAATRIIPMHITKQVLQKMFYSIDMTMVGQGIVLETRKKLFVAF